MTRRSPIRYDQSNDFYQILGVPAWASAEDIQRVFRQRAKEIHPDRNPQQVEWATQQFKRLSEAYAVLGDGDRRDEYDRQRRRYHADEKPRPASTTSTTWNSPAARPASSRASSYQRGDEWWNRPHPRQGEEPPPQPQAKAQPAPRPSATASSSRRAAPSSWATPRTASTDSHPIISVLRDTAAAIEILLRGPYRYVLFAAAAVLLANAVFIATTQGRLEEASADGTRTAQAITPVFEAFFPLDEAERATLPAPRCTQDVNISAPLNGDELNFESFDIRGTARGENFRAYTLTIEPVTDPGHNTPSPAWWTLSPEVRSPVTNSVLVAGASIRNVSEGYYRLRLTVFRSDAVPVPSCEIIIRRKR